MPPLSDVFDSTSSNDTLKHNPDKLYQEGISRLPKITRGSEFVGVEHSDQFVDSLFAPLKEKHDLDDFLAVIAPNKFEDFERELMAEWEKYGVFSTDTTGVLRKEREKTIELLATYVKQLQQSDEPAKIKESFRSNLLTFSSSMFEKVNLIRSCYSVLQRLKLSDQFNKNVLIRNNLFIARVAFFLRDEAKDVTFETMSLRTMVWEKKSLQKSFKLNRDILIGCAIELAQLQSTEHINNDKQQKLIKLMRSTVNELDKVKSRINYYEKYGSFLELQKNISLNSDHKTGSSATIQLNETQKDFMKHLYSSENHETPMKAIYPEELPDFTSLFDRIDIRHIIEILYAETQCWLYDELRSGIANEGEVLSKFLGNCKYERNPDTLRTLVHKEETKNSETYKALYYKYKAELEDRNHRLYGGRSTRRKHKKTNKKRKTTKRRKSYRKRY